LIQKEKEDYQEKLAHQVEAKAVEQEHRRRAQRIRFSQMSAHELKQFKNTNYCMSRINNTKEYVPFSEDKYITLIKSA
jgi:hypothetical protein